MSAWVAEVAEADATGDVADLYADIRRTAGIGMVNLIWRHLAARPGVLPWTWAVLRPAFRRGAVAAATDSLRGGIDLGGAAAIPREAYFAAGLDERGLGAIGTILDDYNRGNLANLVAVGALAAFLGGDGASRPARPPDAAAATAPPPPRLPPISDMDGMDGRTAALIRLLSAPLAPPDTPMIPSLYRHLAPWPAYLAMAAASVLAPARLPAALDEAGRLHGRARAHSESLAETLAPAEGIEAPPAAALAAVESLAARFVAGPIAGMVVLGLRLRASLPDGPSRLAPS